MLVFKSYKPLKLEKGMWFISNVNGENIIRELTEVPHDTEEWVVINGYPVEPYIININNINLKDELNVIATPEQIGWYDEGDHSDELNDITVKNINDIIAATDGLVDIQMSALEDDYYVPEYIQDKVIIRIASSDDDDEDEEQLNLEE
jgi:hypothetical protein